VNLLDSGAYFYDTYETKDGKWIAIGALEPQFYREFLRPIGLADLDAGQQMDREHWPEFKSKVAAAIKGRRATSGMRPCSEPMRATPRCCRLKEAPAHPHNIERQTFTQIDGVVQPAPAPRFSRTPPAVQGPPQAPQSELVLSNWGFSSAEIDRLALRKRYRARP